MKNLILATLTGLILLFAASCGGGGGSDPVVVTAINTGGGSISAGSVVPLTATTTGGSGQVMLKNWAVTSGSLMINPPDFSLTLRETAKSASTTSVSTTANVVYWVVPESAGSATISVTVEGASRTLDVSFGASPVTMSINNGSNGQRIVSVHANDINDLFGAAFRINFSDSFEPVSAEAGDFLGASGDILFLGLTNQSGFVPVAITKKQGATGTDGSGTLATITFAPVGSTSRSSSQAESFSLESLFFIDSSYARIHLGN